MAYSKLSITNNFQYIRSNSIYILFYKKDSLIARKMMFPSPTAKILDSNQRIERETENDLIVMPPDDMKMRIDKIARSTRQYGTSFLSLIQQTERFNPEFDFLKADNIYHRYFKRELQNPNESQPSNSSKLKETMMIEESLSYKNAEKSDFRKLASDFDYIVGLNTVNYVQERGSQDVIDFHFDRLKI